MLLIDRLRKLLKRTALRAPYNCRQFELSLITSSDDEPGRPSPYLIETALQAVVAAQKTHLPAVSARVPEPPLWPDLWPGEHYRLLAGLIANLRPSVVVEIGTYTGLSALAMLETLPQESRLITFDIIPWDDIPHTHFQSSDFDSGRLTQVISDLADPASFKRHLPLLQQADLIFVDGPKNVHFEEAFLSSLEHCQLPREPLIVLDDIRLWNMLRIWRGITRPKLDLTSFGHWSGTGFVHWTRSGTAEVPQRAA